jgi:hypothetical protein
MGEGPTVRRERSALGATVVPAEPTNNTSCDFLLALTTCKNHKAWLKDRGQFS